MTRQESVAKDFEAIAISQAETMNGQAEQIRELIRDVHKAQGEAESARILAGKYASKAGEPADEQSIREAAEWDTYWRTRLEREHHALEMFQDEIIRNVLINYLDKHVGTGLIPEQVRKVATHIRQANDGCRRHAESVKQPTSKPQKPKTRRVETVDLPDLFGGAA